MSSSMFQRLGNSQPTQQQAQQQMPDMNKLYQQFQKNPLKYLPNAPQGVTEPLELLRYYADSGKIPPMLQGRVNAILGRK